MMRVVSCFAGIGGFDLGAAQSGMVTVAHVEKDENCRRLLESKWPDAVSLPNILFAGRSSLPDCDVVCGGFPCQDLSVAGARAGLAGARSGLFYELTRVTHELQPAFLVWENVPGLLSSNKGHDFLAVLTELRRIGYSGGWRTLDAQYFGLAQRRRRVFGVFARRDIGAERCAEILSLGEGVRGHSAPRREAGEGVAGALAACLNSGGNSGGFRTEPGSHLVCGTVSSKWAKGTGGPARDECYNLVLGFPAQMSGTQCASEENLSPVLQAHNPTAVAIGVGESPHLGHCLRSGASKADKHESTTYVVQAAAPAIALQEVGKRTGKSTEDVRCGIGIADEGAPMFTLQAGPQHGVSHRMIVRRLTPRECERLQGFPDDWTAGFSDSCQYRMLGNAVAVPVARWLFSRMASVRL